MTLLLVLLLSKKVETAASRSKLWDSKKNTASCLEEEVISQKELMRAAFTSEFESVASLISLSISITERERERGREEKREKKGGGVGGGPGGLRREDIGGTVDL